MPPANADKAGQSCGASLSAIPGHDKHVKTCPKPIEGVNCKTRFSGPGMPGRLGVSGGLPHGYGPPGNDASSSGQVALASFLWLSCPFWEGPSSKRIPTTDCI